MGTIAQQSIRGALANYAGVAIGFLTVFFVQTRCLTEEEVGLTRMMVDAATLFSSLAMLGTNSTLVRYFPWFDNGNRNRGIFGWSVLAPAVGFAVMLALFFIFRRPLIDLYAPNSPLAADYFYLLPMLTVFLMYLTVFETNASVLMKVAVPKMVREVGIRVLTLMAYILYGTHVIGFTAFVWIFCLGYGAAMLLNLFYLFKLGRITLKIERGFPDRAMLREMGSYSLYMTATVLAGNVPLMNSLFLGAKAGAALTGVYAIASYMANVVEVPYRSLGAIARPVISKAVKENNIPEVNRLVREVSLHQMLVSLLIFFVIYINLDVLFELLPNGERYAGGAIVVVLLGLSKVINSSLSIGTDVLNFSRHYRIGVLFILMLTGTAILLNTKLIGTWGIGGSAAATLLAYLFYFTLLLCFVWRKLRVSLFSLAQLKVAALMVTLVALDMLWRHTITPLIAGGSLTQMIIDAILKSGTLCALAAAVTYLWRISPTFNAMIDKRIGKIDPRNRGDRDAR